MPAGFCAPSLRTHNFVKRHLGLRGKLLPGRVGEPAQCSLQEYHQSWFTSQVSSSKKWSFSVWYGICDETLIGSVLLDGSLTAGRYLNEVLHGPAEEFCANLPLAQHGQLCFQHGGCLAQSSCPTHTYLSHAFPNQCWGRLEQYHGLPGPRTLRLWISFCEDTRRAVHVSRTRDNKEKIIQVCHEIEIPKDVLLRVT